LLWIEPSIRHARTRCFYASRYRLHAFVCHAESRPCIGNAISADGAAVGAADHLARNDEEYRRIQRYIEWNPVKAGLVAAPEEFPWSSATPGQSPAAAQKG
jgi:hypothetical protein